MSFFRSKRAKTDSVAQVKSEQKHTHAGTTALPPLPDFEGLSPEQKNNYLNKINLDLKVLQQQDLKNLYHVSRHLEKSIDQQKFAKFIPNQPAPPPGELDIAEKEKLLKLVKAQFNHRITKSPEFEIIKENSRKYLQENAPKVQRSGTKQLVGFLKKTKHNFGTLLDSKRTSNYLQLYGNHLKQTAKNQQKKDAFDLQEKAKDILPRDFSTLNSEEKNIFAAAMLKQPEHVQEQIISSQSINDLKSLREYFASNADFKPMDDKVKNHIANIETKFEGVRKAYGDIDLLRNYLIDNPKVVLDMLQAQKKDVDTSRFNIAYVGPSMTDDYNVSISCGQGKQTKYVTCEISNDTAKQYASAQFAAGNKGYLKQLINTPSPEQKQPELDHSEKNSRRNTY